MTLNRQARRAAQRAGRKARPQLAGFQPFLTYDEVSILEEALKGWLEETRELAEELGPDIRRDWALKRAEKMRQAFSAALENRPWYDTNPEREEPPG